MSRPSSTTLAGAALRLSGCDALTVLHNIATQALDDLPAGGSRSTTFCDFRGRLLHRAQVARAQGDVVWMLRPDAPADTLAAFIDRHVFREDVHIDDRSAELPVRWVRAALEEHAIEWTGDAPARAWFAPGIAIAVGDAPGETLDEPGRIRAGIARHGHEIRDEFTPYEVGLAGDVHLAKGCFTGQEALMRLITYKSVRRALARVSGPGAPPEVPADVLGNGEPAGRLTSAAAVDDGWIGLAVLKRELLASGAGFMLADGAPLSTTTLPETRPQGRQ